MIVTARIEIPVAQFSEEQLDAFRVLEMEPTSDASEVKKAYRVQLSQYHPDRVASLGSGPSPARRGEDENHQCGICDARGEIERRTVKCVEMR
jgi:preprotein translocase subunit Sec63